MSADVVTAYHSSPLSFLVDGERSRVKSLADFFLGDIVQSVTSGSDVIDIHTCQAAVTTRLEAVLACGGSSLTGHAEPDAPPPHILSVVALHLCGYDATLAVQYAERHDLRHVVALVRRSRWLLAPQSTAR